MKDKQKTKKCPGLLERQNKEMRKELERLGKIFPRTCPCTICSPLNQLLAKLEKEDD